MVISLYSYNIWNAPVLSKWPSFIGTWVLNTQCCLKKSLATDTGGRVLCSNLAELRTVECFGRNYSSYACDCYFSSYYNWEQWIHCNFLLKRDYLWGCSAGWLPAGWLALSLTKSLFTSCQNSIFLSHQSAGTVFFSPAEQALHYYWQTINPDQQWARRSAPIFLVVHNEQRYFTRT